MARVRTNPAKFRLKEASGRTYTWSESELDDTLFESANWEGKKSKVLALEPGKSITVAGETVTRLGAPKRKKKSTEKARVSAKRVVKKRASLARQKPGIGALMRRLLGN